MSRTYVAPSTILFYTLIYEGLVHSGDIDIAAFFCENTMTTNMTLTLKIRSFSRSHAIKIGAWVLCFRSISQLQPSYRCLDTLCCLSLYPMLSLPEPRMLCFLLVLIASLRISRTHVCAAANYAPLVLPSANETGWTLTDNATAAANESSILPDSTFADSDIAWPENFISPNVSSPSRPTPSSNTSLGVPDISCNGTTYGKNLNVGSCLQALGKMPTGSRSVVFGQRGRGDWEANLPLRVLSTNGVCAIDVSHRAGAIFDSISPSELKESARILIDVCVRGKLNTGGVLSNIGKHGNLALRVTPYRPKVRCGPEGSSPPPVDCRNLVDRMPADGAKQVFGPKDDPDPEITVQLPKSLTTTVQQCQVVVDTLLPGEGKDATDWYKLCKYNEIFCFES